MPINPDTVIHPFIKWSTFCKLKMNFTIGHISAYTFFYIKTYWWQLWVCACFNVIFRRINFQNTAYYFIFFFAGMWEVPMTAIKDVRGGTCAMADGCYYEEDAASIQKIFTQNFLEHYTKSKAPFPLFFHSAWFFNRAHRQDGFFKFVDSILALPDVYFVTSQELIEWVRTPVPLDSIESSGMFHCNFSDRPARCSGRRKHKCQLKHKGDVRQWASCQRVCPNRYPWVNNLNGEWFVLNSDPEIIWWWIEKKYDFLLLPFLF